MEVLHGAAECVFGDEGLVVCVDQGEVAPEGVEGVPDKCASTDINFFCTMWDTLKTMTYTSLRGRVSFKTVVRKLVTIFQYGLSRLHSTKCTMCSTHLHPIRQ